MNKPTLVKKGLIIDKETCLATIENYIGELEHCSERIEERVETETLREAMYDLVEALDNLPIYAPEFDEDNQLEIN